MKYVKIAAIVLCGIFLTQLSYAAEKDSVTTMTIEGTIEKISWHPDRFVKGVPGMSGSGAVDRTIPAYYMVTLTDTKVTSRGDGFVFESGTDISTKLDHPKDDGFLKKDMRVKIIDFSISGDQGGLSTTFEEIKILKKK